MPRSDYREVKIHVASCLALLAVLATNPVQAEGEAPRQAPDAAAIARAGAESSRRFQEGAASWTMEFTLQNGLTIYVEAIKSPDKRLWTLGLRAGTETTELARIVQREGLWYVFDQGAPLGKYRPFEAPLTLSTAYLFLTISDPEFMTSEEVLLAAQFADAHGTTATYYSPITPAIREMAEQILARVRSLLSEHPEIPPADEVRVQAERAQRILDKGLAIDIDTSTGMVLRKQAADQDTRITNFRWLEDLDEHPFTVDPAGWRDFTGDPLEGADPHDLAMLGYAGLWRPGAPTVDPDCVLVNLRTDVFRRIPFRGQVVYPGCFLKNRTHVLITGMNRQDRTAMRLYDIELSTGKQQPFGPDVSFGHVWMMPQLSPDGATVAVCQLNPVAAPVPQSRWPRAAQRPSENRWTPPFFPGSRTGKV